MAKTASQEFLLRFSRWASVAIIALGCIVWLGWLFHVQILKSGAPHLVAMDPVTAGMFVLSGIALIRAGKERKQFDVLRLLCAVLVTLGGAMKILECVFGLNLHFGEPLFRGEAINTALNFICSGAALLLLDVETKRGFRPAQTFIIIVGMIGLLALIGYAYRVLPLYSIGSSIPMALNSAMAFELFSVAALAVRPGDGIMRPITSDTTGGAMARRLLPAAVLIPFILGALRFSSEKHGFFEIESGISLFTFANIVLFAAVIWWNAKLLFLAEQERQRTMNKLKEMTRDLEHSNTELQQFAYVASHDLTEPLRMVTSYLELLSGRASGKLGAEEREFIEYAIDGARRMQGLIQDLLAYARVETRARPLETVDSERVLETVLANLKVAISEGHAVIEHDRLPVVKGDSMQLTLVFQNLIGNAIKFRGKESPRICIAAARDNGEWVFEIKDNGIGIDPKHFNRLFVLFQRLHTRQEYPGTGMGLAICKKIIERHGGRIWVESKPNQGASFFFTLPANGEKPA